VILEKDVLKPTSISRFASRVLHLARASWLTCQGALQQRLQEHLDGLKGCVQQSCCFYFSRIINL
jgi:hypothetical protein